MSNSILSNYSVVMSTCADLAEAQKIAEALVNQKLAACVNIIPNVHSVYMWQGNVVSDTECKLLIKTHTQSVDAVIQAITSLHSYDTPEVQAIAITAGNKDYFNWIDEVLS